MFQPETKISQHMLKFHHVGLAVGNMEVSKAHYEELFGKESTSDVFCINSQKVNVCFVKIAENAYIELVEPIGEDSQVATFLKKRITYYHIAYKVEDIVKCVTSLEKLNYKPLEYFRSEAFSGKRCIFLFSPEAHLIELIEE